MIWVIGGTCDFRRGREWLRLKLHLEKAGQRISTIDSGGDVFGQEPPWLLVEDAESRKDLESFLGRNCIFLYAGKKPEKAPWLAKVERKGQVWHDAPTPWEAAALAQEFVIQEGSNFKLEIPKDIAVRLVARSGTDLALLSREVQKLSCTGLGCLEDVTTDWGGVPLDDLLGALGRQDTQKVSVMLPRFGKGPSGAIMVSRLLASQVLLWLGAAELESRNCATDLVAETLGVHPYRYRVGMQEMIKKLGYRKIRDLVRCLSAAEMAVQTGKIDPWNVLMAGILDWCQKR